MKARERKATSRSGPAKPPIDRALQRLGEPKNTGRKSGSLRKPELGGRCCAPIGWFWACAEQPREALASLLAPVHRDTDFKSSLRNLTVYVRVLSPTAEAPQVRNPYKPLYFSCPPQPCERVPPRGTLAVLSALTLLIRPQCPRGSHGHPGDSPSSSMFSSSPPEHPPARGLPAPAPGPWHQERERPSWCAVSSLLPSHHPQPDVLSSSSLALVPVHGYQNILETLTSTTTRPSITIRQAPPRSDPLSQGWKLSPTNSPLVLLAHS